MTKRKRTKKAIFLGGLCCAALILCAAAAAHTSFAEEAVSSVKIVIDYGDCDIRDLPKGQAGKSYPVFDCTATDENGNSVNDVNITVKSPSGEILPQKGGRFETAEIGEYTIGYAASNSFTSATETVKIEVEAYTDSLQYNATGENIQSRAVTGNVVLAFFGKYVGGVGDLTETISLKFGNEELPLKQSEKGAYFIPEKSGEYVITYTATDFIGDEKHEERTVAVEDSGVPVLTKASLPASAIEGETLDLPLCDGVLYQNGAKYYLPVKTTFDGTDVSGAMRAENLQAGNHIVVYECVNPADSTKKAIHSFQLIVKSKLTDEQKKDGARLFDNYFDFENCEPFTSDAREYRVKINAGTEEAKFSFSRGLPVAYLNFDIATRFGRAEYEEINWVLTDSRRAEDCVKVKISHLKSYKNLWLSYNDENKTIVNADTGETLDKIGSYTDGRAFDGFKSGKAYISFEVRGVKKDVDFVLRKVGSNVINANSVDRASPVFLPNTEYKAIVVAYIGHTVNFPKMQAFDLLDKTPKVTLKVTDGEGNTVYKGENGYVLKIEKAGEYAAEYTARDSDGNRKTLQTSVYVADTKAPEIKVTGIKANVKVGEEIVLPTAEITDNATPAEEITSYIYVLKGNNRKQLIEGSYKFTEAGEYKIRYVAFDSYQNYTVVEFTVYCK